jgi:hypothetical protein
VDQRHTRLLRPRLWIGRPAPPSQIRKAGGYGGRLANKRLLPAWGFSNRKIEPISKSVLSRIDSSARAFIMKIGAPPVYTGFHGPPERVGSKARSSATKSPDHTTAFRFSKRRQCTITLARAAASGSFVCLRFSLSFVSITLRLRHRCRWLRPDILPWLPCKAPPPPA